MQKKELYVVPVPVLDTYALTVCALLTALSVVLARLLTIIPSEVRRFSLEAVPILLAGLLFGPLPGAAVGAKIPINVHADEFNELMGDEFIPMVNKGGGAGVQVTAYTQTLSDIEARIGNRAKAGQVVGNFNNLFMLRVRETATAELLTRQLPKVEVYATALMSGATDSSDPHGNTAFTSNTQDRISTTSVPLIEPAHVVALPEGQCFALIEGGNLWKVRMPLPAPDPDEAMPKDLQELAGYMRRHYVEAGDWWENQGVPGLQDMALPADLVDDFKQMAAAEEAEA